MRLLFDHGTLVLVDAPDFGLAAVPGLTWDPRVGLYRAPAHRHPELVEALVRAGLPFRDEVPAALARPAAWAEVALRPYQAAAALAWEISGRRGLVVLPTGSGKTRVALSVLAESGARALCVVPTRALLRQWLSELERFYAGPLGCVGDGECRLEAVTVATFESAYRHMPRIGRDFELLIVDEVHHFGAGIRDEALEMCAAAARLGLTATPPGAAALRRLEGLVGPVVHRVDLAELTGGWLAAFDLIVLTLGLDASERELYAADQERFRRAHREFGKRHPEATWAEFAAFCAASPEGRAALAAFHRARRAVGWNRAKARAVRAILARHRGSKILIFTADNAAAYAIAREHLVMPITCDVGRKERERALAAFRGGELEVLVSSRVLNEGLDVPDAEVAIVVGGTLGEREHVQRVGRLLRPAPGKRAIIYELVTRSTSEVRKSLERRRGLATAELVSAQHPTRR